MWKVNQTNLSMVEGDYGLTLPITVRGTTLAAGDLISFKVKKLSNRETVLDKTFADADIENNTFSLEITSTETARLPADDYVYILDWYRNGMFMCNIIRDGVFRVEAKP